MWQGSIVLLDCEEGVVNIVQGSIWKDKVRRVWWGKEGDISIGILDHLIEGSGVLFIKSIEF
jgi:hypothetical protein